MINIYGSYGSGYRNGAPVFICDGTHLYHGRGTVGEMNRALCTISGRQVFLGFMSSGSTLCTVDDNGNVYAGHGGGPPLFKIEGNRAYDGYGGGAPILTASDDDEMALAAAACLTRNVDEIRVNSDNRLDDSLYTSAAGGPEDRSALGLESDTSSWRWGGVDDPSGGVGMGMGEIVCESPRIYFSDLSPVQQEIQRVHPWYANALLNETSVYHLPKISFTKDPLSFEARMYFLQSTGANYKKHGVVMSRREFKSRYSDFEWVTNKNLGIYYERVPLLLSHDEYVNEILPLVLEEARAIKDATLKRRAEIKAREEAEWQEILRKAGYRYLLETPDMYVFLTAFLVSLAGLLTWFCFQGTWGGFFGLIGMFFTAVFTVCSPNARLKKEMVRDQGYDTYVVVVPTTAAAFLVSLNIVICGVVMDLGLKKPWVSLLIGAYSLTLLLLAWNPPFLYYRRLAKMSDRWSHGCKRYIEVRREW